MLLKGEDITGVPPYKRPVNTVFQKYALFPHLNVFENVAFGLRLKKMDEETIRRKVRDMLEVVGLKGFERRSIGQMSGGQQQRVAIARSLVNEPEILLLDEPLGALDLKLRKEMQLELKRLQREMNITFIYVTHDQEEALTMSDTVVVMNGGKVQQIGTPEDIYNEPKNAFVADFIGDSNIVDGVMHRDFLVSFSGVEFPCVDRGFARKRAYRWSSAPRILKSSPRWKASWWASSMTSSSRASTSRCMWSARAVSGSSIPPAPARPARPSVCASAPTRSISCRVRRGEAA